MNELLKQLLELEERISYLLQIKDYTNWGNLEGFKETCENLKQNIYEHTEEQLAVELKKLNESTSFKQGQKKLLT
jgi:acetyl-CoA carboxylase carboxyl transferase subunit beta